ncbi:MAG: hypothetical protein ABI875_03665, partial [Gemmatimonadales bacterium]
MKLRISMLGLVAALVFSAGCGDSNLFKAQFATEADTFTLFALTGTPAAYPSGLNTFSRVVTRVDGNANFDLAFDIDANGKAVIYPVKLIVSAITGDRIIGLKKVAAVFDSVTSAPTGAYQADSAVVLGVGETVFVIGGTGFIGLRVIRLLAARGEEIVCMDINPGAAAFEDLGRQVRVLR